MIVALASQPVFVQIALVSFFTLALLYPLRQLSVDLLKRKVDEHSRASESSIAARNAKNEAMPSTYKAEDARDFYAKRPYVMSLSSQAVRALQASLGGRLFTSTSRLRGIAMNSARLSAGMSRTEWAFAENRRRALQSAGINYNRRSNPRPGRQ